MADTNTTNLNLVQPEVGSSQDSWGGKLNNNASIIDAIFSATGTSVAMNIDAAVIDNSVIGGTTAAAATFTTLTANTSITGTLATAAQANITSVGTLSALTVSGDLIVDTDTLKVTSGSDLVHIGNTSTGFHSSVHPLIVGSGSGDEGMAIFSGSSNKGKIGFADAASDDSGSYRGYFQYDHSGDNLNIGTAGSEVIRITSSGNLFVGCTASPSASVAGIAIFDNGTSDTGIKSAIAGTGFEYHNRFYDGTGQVGYIATQSSATIFNTTSDYRLKDVKGSIQNGLKRTLALNPVEFEWKSNGTTAEGFIAHEAQEIFADAVTGEKDGEDMQGMDYGRITPLLVKAIQELSAEVEQLKQQAHEKCEN